MSWPAGCGSARTWSSDGIVGGGICDEPADSGAREELIRQAFVALADTLVDEYDVIDLLDRLAGFCVRCCRPTRPASCWATPAGSCAWSPPPDEAAT